MNRLTETPIIVQESSDMDPCQQGLYSGIEGTVFLPSREQMRSSIECQQDKLEIYLLGGLNKSDFKDIVISSREYWNKLWVQLKGIGDPNEYNKRIDSVASHELAHHYLVTMIPPLRKIYEALYNWKADYNKHSEGFRIIRNYEELFATICELNDIGDLGAAHVLIPDFIERCWDRQDSRQTNLERIMDGDEIAGSYNLATAILLGNTYNPTVDHINQGLNLFNTNPQEFIESRKLGLDQAQIFQLLGKKVIELVQVINL